LEDEKLGHGVFTYYLIKGLQGEADKEQKEAKGYDDGVVMITEMENYLANKIQQATKYLQKPSVDGDYDGDFPLSITRSNTSLSSEISKRPKKEKKTEKRDIVEPAPDKTPSLNSECEKRNTGDYCFINKTQKLMEVQVKRTVYYDETRTTGYSTFPRIFLSPGQTQCFYDLPTGVLEYSISPSRGKDSPAEWKASDGQLLVKKCLSFTFEIK
jgi:hypothetical protein